MRLLIAEDERVIAEVMMLNLKRAGYECEYAQNGEVGAVVMEKQSYDLVLLDITLPKTNGYELMEYPAQLQIPVVLIAAKGSVQDRIKGLHIGANNYLAKSFAVDKLMARVESVLRYYHKSMQDIHVLDVAIYIVTHLVEKENRTIALIKKEYELLSYLIQNKNIALYRNTMHEKVWHEEEFEQTRALDLYIQCPRKKLDWHRVIQAVYKIGYMPEVEDEVRR